MRGTRVAKVDRQSVDRFIPAYAGNTHGKGKDIRHSAVHPRVCGEHTLRMHASASSYGSSPRMRGTRHLMPYEPLAYRFIPAYAGNTLAGSISQPPRSVHPRVCGEHFPAPNTNYHVNGSSPRMRGTRTGQREAWRRCRFIPAYAGNTLPSCSYVYKPPVHPRVCGEHGIFANT